MARDTWGQKLKRAFTAFLPVAPNRVGECHNCGACCKLTFRCPFLDFDASGLKAQCRVYRFRPPACRKYPRVQPEQVCSPCGYCFM